ncbi:hypothetical protein ABFB50_00650 [Dehalococcoides sp. THU3]|uniref:hypothetical protein n=1 Tax=Dehalococcoides TaxID=61434 RepID=UPI003218599C
MFTLHVAGVDKTGLIKAHSLRIKREAEGRNECGFTLIAPYSNYNPAIGAEVIARLDDYVVFGGVIKERRIQRLNKNGVIYSSVQVTGQGYNHIPKRRTVQYRPDNVSAGHAVRYMLENVLTDEGITEGIIEDGIALFGYDAELKSVRDILDDLAQSCSFKWYIDDEKKLFFLKSDTVDDAPFQIIESSAEFTDFSEVEVTDTLEGYRNKQFVRAGDRIIVKQNDSEILARAAVEGGTGVYGEVEENTNVQERTDAENLAEELLFRYGSHVPATLRFKTNTHGFDAGQRLYADLPSYGAIGSYLIEQVDISDAGKGSLQFQVYAVKKNFEKTTKRKDTWLDYFQKLVKSSRYGSGSNEEGAIIYSSDPLVIDANERTTLNLSPTVSTTTHLYLAFTITGNATTSSQLQIKLQFNGETVRTYRQVLNQGNNTISVSTIITSVRAGSHSVRLLLSMANGNLTIAAGEHDGYIRAVGMAGIGTAPPEANWVEPVAYIDMQGNIQIIDSVVLPPPTNQEYIKLVAYQDTAREVLEDWDIDTTGVDNCLWFRYPLALSFHGRACVPFIIVEIKISMEPNTLQAMAEIRPALLIIAQKTAVNPESLRATATINNANVEVI